MAGMIDISEKKVVSRTARASGKIFLSNASIKAIKNRTVKKGDALEVARVAAINAVKKTPEIIPHCHPIPVENVDVFFTVGKNFVTAEVEVSATWKTGVEMEALTGVLAALDVIWDMVKYLEKDAEGQYPRTRIVDVRILWKIKDAAQKATHEKHKDKAPRSAKIAVITVSTSRTLKTDISGKVIAELAKNAGHKIASHIVVKDDAEQINKAVKKTLASNVDAVILNGGTGISSSDVTIEAVRPLFEKEMTGFSNLFLKLSAEEIGSPSVLSRATAGIAKGKAIFSIPGSPAACELAMEKIILPELGHILHHAK